MVKKIKIISVVIILLCLFCLFYLKFSIIYDVSVQNRIIDNVFNFDIEESCENENYSYNYIDSEYLGYIYIPSFDIKRLVMYGTDSSVLNNNYVGMHYLSGSLYGDDLIILAGHNVSNVFSKLHFISIGDVVYINYRKFEVYDKKVVNEYDSSYLMNNRKNELLLITCTRKSGERLLVFLKEVL